MVKSLSLSESKRSIGAPRKAERKQVAKKSLSFESATENSSDRSPVSEVSDGAYASNPGKNSLSADFTPVLKCPSLIADVFSGSHSDKSPLLDTPASTSPDAFSVEELSPTSEITTDMQEDTEVTSVKHSHCGDSACSKVRSVEVDIVAEKLKYLLLQTLRSSAIDERSKKLADILIKTVVEEFHVIHEESDLLSKIVRRKTGIVATCFILWMICTLVAVYVNCYTEVPFDHPPPT